jgi:hypothetical protein
MQPKRGNIILYWSKINILAMELLVVLRRVLLVLILVICVFIGVLEHDLGHGRSRFGGVQLGDSCLAVLEDAMCFPGYGVNIGGGMEDVAYSVHQVSSRSRFFVGMAAIVRRSSR